MAKVEHLAVILYMGISLFYGAIALSQDRGVRNIIPVPKEEKEIVNGMGKTWAVLIANSTYTDWPDLKGEPYIDVIELRKALAYYHFDSVIVRHDLTINNFESYFEEIYQDITREKVNSILLYYAGHGEYNQLLDRGYWIPVDAKKESRLGYLDDQTIRGYLKLYSKQVKHVLLISDCCFSGSMLQFRSTDLIMPSRIDLYNLRIDVTKKSVYGITSGRKEERVTNESKFSKALVNLLTRNRNLFLRDEDIAYEVTRSVREVLKQQPQYGPIAETHEFGKFVFIRKELGQPPPGPVNPEDSTQPDTVKETIDSTLPNADFLSDSDVITLVKKKNYYDKIRNRSGTGFHHLYELKVIEGDSIIIDRATGLTWQQSGSPQRMIYEKTKEYVDYLNKNHFASYRDWRLPTLEETMSFMEPKQFSGELYIQPIFDKKQIRIWTESLNSPSWVWAVSFDIGYCFRANTESENYVRAVR